MSNEDNSWVFDSMVAFLNGPIWSAPLQSFIEEKSIIFEPSEQENEEYKKIFEEFKNLVDFMLGNFMEDIGITPEQFQDACAEGKRHHVSFDNSLFEQIWAANDFQMFTRIMTQRNVELQLQALELIERKYGITPESFIPKQNDSKGKPEENKALKNKNLATVKMESKLEQDILEEVAKRFAEEPSTSLVQVVDMENFIEQKPILEEKLKETIAKNEKMKNTPNEEKNEIRDEAKENNKAELTLSHLQKIDCLELKKRQDYLRAQRDKLVALKKEARQKHLASHLGSRPKSAKAAESVLTGEKSTIEASSQLQLRKTLAERLKAEVVDKDQK